MEVIHSMDFIKRLDSCVQVWITIKMTNTLQVESPLIFLDQSGRGRRLPGSSTFRVEHALKIQTYSGVSHA